MSFELSHLQRWMQAAIVGDETSVDRLGITTEMVLPSLQMTGDERLAIYQRAYAARLIECLRAEFPMLCRAIGQELFNEFAAGYLIRHPSTSYTLSELGRQFPAYLAETHPHSDASTAWYETLVDLATLEWVTNEVFNGPGTEQEPPLDMGKFVPETWDTIKLSLAPCVRLLELRYPVHDYYRGLRTNSDSPLPSAAHTRLVISRLDYSVRHHAVSEPQFAMLCEIERGGKLSNAIGAAASLVPEDMDKLAALLHGWFAWLAAERLVRLA